jgi:hypothetical protein
MDNHGVHFLDGIYETKMDMKKRRAEEQIQRTIAEKRRKREQKLQSLEPAQIETSPPCCKQQCLKTVPTNVLVGVRDHFLQMHSQVDRKRAIGSLRCPSSKSSFALAYATYPVCWKTVTYITGASTTLLQSVVGSPCARC